MASLLYFRFGLVMLVHFAFNLVVASDNSNLVC